MTSSNDGASRCGEAPPVSSTPRIRVVRITAVSGRPQMSGDEDVMGADGLLLMATLVRAACALQGVEPGVDRSIVRVLRAGEPQDDE